MEKLEFKGTKGKWTCSPMIGTKGHCHAAQIWDGNGDNLAVIDDKYGEDEASANAKIMAAAPKLLEALIKINKLAECTDDRFANYSDIIYHDSLKAIKKALT